MIDNPNQIIESLVDSWCERRELTALSYVFPAWTSNNGLTDGWAQLRDDLKHAHVMCTHLPADERDSLKQAYVAIDGAIC